MKKKNESDAIIQRIDKDLLHQEILTLSHILHQLDEQSLAFLDLKDLSSFRRMELNQAARTLKRFVIFAETDLWKKLTEKDMEGIQNEILMPIFNKDVQLLKKLKTDQPHSLSKLKRAASR